LKKYFRNFKFLSCLPLVLYLIGLSISKLTDGFRYSMNFHWIYTYGKFTLYIMFIFSIITSLALSYEMIQNTSFDWRNNKIWLFITLIPIIYWTCIFIIINFR
jgi:hypothetical protein